MIFFSSNFVSESVNTLIFFELFEKGDSTLVSVLSVQGYSQLPASIA